MMVRANDIFPIFKVEQGCVVSMQGDISVVYRLTLPEIFTLSESDYEGYHRAWVKAIRVLPKQSILHKMDWFVREGFKADFDRAGESFLGRNSERFFAERQGLAHECFVVLTKKPVGSKLSSSVYSNILRKRIVPSQVLDERLKGDFLDACGQFERILSDSGFVGLERLGDDELAGTANNPGLIERYTFLLGRDEPSLLRDIRVKSGLRVGEKAVELYTLSGVEELPALCGSRINYDRYSTDRSKFSIGFASPLGQLLDCNHIYNQYVFIGDDRELVKKLEARKLRLQSLSGYSRENAASAASVNDFLNEAVVHSRLPVKAHFNVLCWSEDEEELRDLKNRVGAAMAQLDAVAKLETEGAAQVWFAGLPGNAGDFPMNETFDTFVEQASCLFNLESNDRDSISPFGMRLGDRLSGMPLHVDLSDAPMKLGQVTNRNKFILGPSGSGKSFFTNHMVRSYYEQGAHVVLVDVGHSYRGLCELVGGYYFSYSEVDPIKFNPFYLADGEVLDTEKKESIKTLLVALWKRDDERFKRSEYVALSNALTLYYQFLQRNSDIFPCFNSFYEFLLSDYVAVLEKGKVKDSDFDVSSFLYVLQPYYRGGEFDYLLNATENLDLLHQPFIVMELDNIKDHPILFPVVTLILMEMFISKMRKLKGIRKVLLIEECWKAIAKEGMAEYIKYLFKTVRKYFGEAIVVTQEVEDIISSPVVKQAIINNADCKILLDQSKYQSKFTAIQELLGLTDKEKALILSMNRANDPGRKYKEVFISLGGQYSKVYRTEVSLREYLCYTTEESEKVKLAEYAQRYGSMQKGIEMLARDLEANNQNQNQGS
jgi:conjugation system TraG family ATPase